MTTPLVPDPETAAPLDRRVVLALVLATVIVYVALWGTWPFLPIRWFVTLVHELSHAVMVELVGGETTDVTINRAGGGLTRSRLPDSTGRALLVSSAGYVGTALFGALLLGLTGRVRSGQAVFLGIALASVLAAVAWVPWNVTVEESAIANAAGAGSGDGRFTWIFVLSIAAAFVGAAVLAPVRLRQALAVVLATFCTVSALEDLRRLIGISATDGSHSDATVAESLTGVDAWFFAVGWAALAAAAVLAGIWATFRTTSS